MGRNQASIVFRVKNVFRLNGFFAELDSLAAVRHVRRTFLLPTIGCVDRFGKPPASLCTHPFCDFLVCPEYRLKRRLRFCGVDLTDRNWAIN